MPENSRHRQAFNHYWELGPERSIARLHEAMTAEGLRPPTLRTLFEWSRKFHWQHRLVDLEREARAADDAARIAAIREMEARQAKEALLLQQRGAERLATLEAEEFPAGDAIRALIEGAKLERLSRGEVTERQELQEVGDPRLERFSDDELERLAELAERDLERAADTDSG